MWDMYKMCPRSVWMWIFSVSFYSTSGSNSSDSDGLPAHLLNQPETVHLEVERRNRNLCLHTYAFFLKLISHLDPCASSVSHKLLLASKAKSCEEEEEEEEKFKES